MKLRAMSTSINIVLFIFLISVVHVVKRSKPRLPLPPGPRKYPIIGNLLDMPTSMQWLKFTEWSKQYGSDIIHLEVLGNSIIVLNSVDAADDLLVRRSSIYSSRPWSTMMHELMGWNWALGFIPYGDRWRRHRRLFWQEFNPVNSKLHYPQELKYSRALLCRLLDSPERFMDHCRWCFGAMVISISYGLDAKSDNDPYIKYAEEAMNATSESAITGSFIVDHLPLLKYIPAWFPGAKFQKVASWSRFVTKRMIEVPFAAARKLHSSETSSFLSRCLARTNEADLDPTEEETIKNVVSVAFAAGSETTQASMVIFIASMLLHPEVQKKAQTELDALLRHSRLPDFNDLDSLPYIHAIILEVIRWHPVAPLGLTRFSIMEDEYKGYRIPANSIIFYNTWGMLQDEENFPEPEKFKPERFLQDGKVADKYKDPKAFFGFGRRICPGRFMVMNSLWILAASILSVFDILKAVNENGQEVEPNIEFAGQSVRYALPFKCTIRARSAQAEKLIRENNQSNV